MLSIVSIGIGPRYSELFYKGTILQRNCREKTSYGHFPVIPL